MKKSKKHIRKNKRLWIWCFCALIICAVLCAFAFNRFYMGRSLVATAVESETAVADTPQEPTTDSESGSVSPEQKQVKIRTDRVERDWEAYIKKNLPTGKESDAGTFNARINDKQIVLKWDIPADTVQLVVKNGWKEVYRTDVHKTGTYTFTNGEHGTKYDFLLEFNDNGQDFYKKLTRIFLEFDKLPVLTTFYIETADGADPTCQEIKKPHGDDYYGLTVVSNGYKDATLNGDTPIKIRVRGNSSALSDHKRGYKIVFNEKKDMLGLGDEYADTEWVLLGQFGIKTYLGFEMGRAIGIEWEPRMRFVNVMLNGNWKGLYVLCEPVKRHPKRLNVDSDGFIIESDAYWWREQKDTYFPSSVLAKKVKFTFKYPKKLTSSDERFIATENQIKEIDNAIQNDLEHIDKYIDFDSHINWLLAHELLGTQDGFGSNMFFYKENPNGKLKMGPLWDFDSSFAWPKRERSKFWTTESTYLPFLLKNPDFRRRYRERYFAVVPTIEETMRSSLEKLKDIPGLAESMKLEGVGAMAKMGGVLDTQSRAYLVWFHEHIDGLNQKMQEMSDVPNDE